MVASTRTLSFCSTLPLCSSQVLSLLLRLATAESALKFVKVTAIASEVSEEGSGGG